MDSFYDDPSARSWLEQYITARVQSGATQEYLTTFRVEQANVIKFAEPRSLRLTEEILEGTQEVEVRIPGIICSKTLPPQQRELSVGGDDQVRLLRQFVKLTGLGSPMFEGMGDKIREVWGAFSKAASPSSIPEVAFKAYDGDFAIDAHTRYFTDRRHAPSLKHEGIPQSVDPRRFLDVARGPNFIYTHENVVEYCEQSSDGDYQSVGPEVFQIGDVVEVVAAFVAYPAGKDQYILKLTMRSLCMVNSQFRQDAVERRRAFQSNAMPKATAAKEGKRVRGDEGVHSGPLLRRRKLTSNDN